MVNQVQKPEEIYLTAFNISMAKVSDLASCQGLGKVQFCFVPGRAVRGI